MTTIIGAIEVPTGARPGDVTFAQLFALVNYAVGTRRVVLVYSASITPDASLGNFFDVSPTNGTAFTINAPTNPVDGQRITVTVRNVSGGALGVITWNAVFKMAAFANPANGFSASIDFRYDGTNWVEISRGLATVPN